MKLIQSPVHTNSLRDMKTVWFNAVIRKSEINYYIIYYTHYGIIMT